MPPNGGAGAPELVMTVGALLTQWEGSDQLASEFAKRLVLFFAGHLNELLEAKRELERPPT